MKKFKIVNSLVPISIALFANSSIVEKKKRTFRAWIKAKKLEDLAIVKEYYKYSNKKSLEALKILTENNINNMKQSLSKGGKSP